MPDRSLSPDLAALPASAEALTSLLRGLDDPELLAAADPALVQQLLAAAVALYARKLELDGGMAPFPGGGVPAPTAGEVCAAASRMLEAVSVEVFELALWKSWAQSAGATGAGS